MAESIKALSWNVNGIRAAHKKGFLEWFSNETPEILCLQETKAHVEQLPEALINVKGYRSYFSSGVKKGYSGVALYTKTEPIEVSYGFGIEKFDNSATFYDFCALNLDHARLPKACKRCRVQAQIYVYRYCVLIFATRGRNGCVDHADDRHAELTSNTQEQTGTLRRHIRRDSNNQLRRALRC